MTSRTALISNPRSHLVSRRGSRLEAAAASRPGIPLIHTGDLAEFTRAMTGALDAGAVNFIIEGGDGTVLAALSACYTHAPDRLADLSFALLPGGSTNLAHARLGLKDTSVERVEALLGALDSGAPTGPSTSQSALIVQQGDGTPAHIGFLLSTGALAHAMDHVQHHMFGPGQRGAPVVALSLLKLAAQPHSFRDSDGKPLLSPSTFNFQSTGQTLPGGEHAFSLATTFASLSLGLKPWWGKGDGDIHMTYAPWPLKALRRAIFRSITGTALERLEAKGYRSLNTNSFTLQIDRPWMLDGETLPVHASSPLQVSTTRPLTFLR